jgi:hypothetical protein
MSDGERISEFGHEFALLASSSSHNTGPGYLICMFSDAAEGCVSSSSLIRAAHRPRSSCLLWKTVESMPAVGAMT